MGLEPIRSESHAPQTCASASSATSAYEESIDSCFVSLTEHWYYTTLFTFCQGFFSIFLSFVAFYKLSKIFGASLGKMHTAERRATIFIKLYPQKIGTKRKRHGIRPQSDRRSRKDARYIKLKQNHTRNSLPPCSVAVSSSFSIRPSSAIYLLPSLVQNISPLFCT